MPDSTLSRDFVSGGSRASYPALDRAKNDLDTLQAEASKTMDRIRSALWDLQQNKGCYGDKERLSAIEVIADVVSDLTWDRARDLKDEIEALEVALEDR
jgi:hypothetical protein